MGVREGGDGEAVPGDPSASGGQEMMSGVHAAQQDLHFLINSDQLPGFMTSGTTLLGVQLSGTGEYLYYLP
jgi:hypothetical protein